MAKIIAILGSISAALVVIARWADKLSKIIEPVVKEAENLALDGKIDKADRKKIALKLLSELEAQGTIKLNFLSRIVINIIIDIVARKLPDFDTTYALKNRKDSK